MKFEIRKKANPQAKLYSTEELDIARNFAKKVHKEFGVFAKSIVLFGSTARKPGEKKHDIDILVIVNDLTIGTTSEVVQTYRVIMEKLIEQTSKRIHLTTLKLTNFYEFMRTGDPIAINILRDGVAIIDTGFFDPWQALLYQGRIRPTYESIWTYMNKAPVTLENSRWHLLQATLDLYWAVIDAAHAALMKIGEIPPSPEHVSQILDDKLVKSGRIPSKYSKTMDTFYKLSKQILYREVKEISGPEYERLYKDAKDFVAHMRTFIEA